MDIYEPKITSVAISPNPVNINTSVKISVAVTEAKVTMYKKWPVAGVYRTGQTINLSTRKEVAT